MRDEEWKSIEVHSGIFNLAEKILGEVKDWIEGNKNFLKNKKVVFTGHSLGGGLALALRLLLQSHVNRGHIF